MNLARVRIAILPLSLLLCTVLSSEIRVAIAQVIIDNGTVQLGINPEGHLNVLGGTPSLGGTTAVGLRYVPTNGESTAPGCLCEGWGVGNLDGTTGLFTGYANVDTDGGAQGLVVQPETEVTATAGKVRAESVGSAFRSVVETSNGRLRITHHYQPSSSPNLYEVDVTIENIGETPIGDLRYRRVMDWDIEPTPFSEWVRIHVGDAANLVRATTDGFNSANPANITPPGAGSPPTTLVPGNADYVGGPDDQGALFDFQFGALPPGGIQRFKIYYGAAANETEALAALAAVGAEVYSFGLPSGPAGPATDGPNVFIFAFGGVGGTPVGCANPDGPCISRRTNVEMDFPLPGGGTSPGAGLEIDWVNLTQVQVHKTGQTFAIEPCTKGPTPQPSNVVEFDQTITLPGATVLTKGQAKNARNTLLSARKKLLTALKRNRTVRLAVADSSGSNEILKMFQFNPVALDVARELGCAGVQIVYTYTLVGSGLTGDTTVSGGGSVDWLVEEP